MITWARRNLFRTPLDAAITVVVAVVSVYLLYKASGFVLVSGRWEIVRENSKILFIGRFPEVHTLRLSVLVVVLAAWGGLIAGLIHGRRVLTGRYVAMSAMRRVADLAERFWIPALAVLVALWTTHTIGPWITALLAIVAGVIGRLAGSLIGRRLLGRAVKTFIGLVLVATPVILYVYVVTAVGYDQWGGLLLTVFIAVVSIVLCFPLGVLAALGRKAGISKTSHSSGVVLAVIFGGAAIFACFMTSSLFLWAEVPLTLFVAAIGYVIGRRSTLPLIRIVSTAYIELVRAAPLYVLLLLAQVALHFFLPEDMAAPSKVTRAIAVFTLFTGAYMAEIIRGGLQSVPPGQAEAAKALGLGPTRETFFIVLPQALRNVIPAQIGQLISLFKDTSLAGAALGIFELYNAVGTLTTQPGFDPSYIGEAIAFAAFLYWVISYTMSRESQRFERRLGVGTR